MKLYGFLWMSILIMPNNSMHYIYIYMQIANIIKYTIIVCHVFSTSPSFLAFVSGMWLFSKKTAMPKTH